MIRTWLTIALPRFDIHILNIHILYKAFSKSHRFGLYTCLGFSSFKYHPHADSS